VTFRFRAAAASLTLVAMGGGLMAQQRPSFTPLAVGAEAPAFSLRGATKDGVLPKEVSLLDFRGQTVVLAFFYRARTGG
jgi:peroxiredoxin Q/BCP